MADEQRDQELRELISTVTRGLGSLQEQSRERDTKLALVEYKIEEVKTTLAGIKTDIEKASMDRLSMRVEVLEKDNELQKKKQAENGRWIKTLIGGLIILFLGFLFNFIRITAR